MAHGFELIKEGFNPAGSVDDLKTLRSSQSNLTPETEASAYHMPKSLATAINVALHTGMPLLLTGDPGAGKTMAAFAIAHRFGMPDVLRFQVRSDSRAQELRYRYDAAGHFRAVQTHDKDSGDPKPGVWDFIEPGKLWLAIAPRDEGRPKITNAATSPARPEAYSPAGPVESIFRDRPLLPLGAQKSSFQPQILLIDEIDKAPRDFPNDLLNELERLEFDIPEAPRAADGRAVRVRIGDRPRPIIVITSNAERRLPEPFLRRCVYHHIRLSDLDGAALEAAVSAHLGPALVTRLGADTIPHAAKMYVQFSVDETLRKRPSLPEIKSWLIAIANSGELGKAKEALSATSVNRFALPLTGALFKTRDDLMQN